MAQIILKTNIAKNFLINQASVEVPTNKRNTPDPVKMTISPVNNYKLDAGSFSHGILPNEIKNITFNQSNNNIIATVYFNDIIINTDIKPIFLPISGSVFLDVNKYNLIETTTTDSSVIINENNTLPVISTSSNNNSITKEYSISGKPGEIVKVLTKSFSVPYGYYFSSPPTHNISAGAIRNYKVKSTSEKDVKNRVIKKTIEVSFVFPLSRFSSDRVDNISFSYVVAEIKSTNEESTYNKEKPQEIYSVDTGRNPGTGGGTKFITVKGAPGTPFRLLVQDTDNAYNFKTGSFSTDGSPFEGIMPPARKGAGLSVYRLAIDVPASSTARTISTQLLDQKVDHDLLVSSPGTKQIGSKIDEVIKKLGTLTLSLHNGGESGFVISRPEFKTDTLLSAREFEYNGQRRILDGSYVIGSEKYGMDISDWVDNNPIKTYDGVIKKVAWLITTDADNKFIRINRQPKFKQSADFIVWDSAYDSEDTKSFNSSGVPITTDWGNITASPDETLDFKNFNLDIKAGVEPGSADQVENRVSGAYDPLAYKAIILSVSIDGTFGDDDLTAELNLKNFITIFTHS